MMKAVRRLWLIVGLSFLGIVWTIWAATWVGYWGGRSRYPGTEPYERGRWKEPPICYQFLDTTERNWSEAERRVARAAIGEWGARLSPGMLQECTDPTRADIVLFWATERLFKNFGDPNRDGFSLNLGRSVALYVPIRVAPPLQWEPCPDLKAAGALDRCSVAVFHAKNPLGWFVDPTPELDEEFEPQKVTLCGVPRTVLKAKKGGPADGRHDLYTIVLHEFGHALGLVHSGGCDGDPRVDGPQDDDGSVMWEGFLGDRRELLEEAAPLIGQGERRHPTEQDYLDLGGLYCPDLTVRNLRVNAIGPIHGTWTLMVSVSVQNVGNMAAGPFVVTVTRNGRFVFEQEFEGLEPGASETMIATEMVGAGLHLIEVRADSRNQIEECNEGNNVASRLVQLGGPED